MTTKLADIKAIIDQLDRLTKQADNSDMMSKVQYAVEKLTSIIAGASTDSSGEDFYQGMKMARDLLDKEIREMEEEEEKAPDPNDPAQQEAARQFTEMALKA